MTEHTTNLQAAMVSRASDLVQFMARHGIRVQVADGTAKAGEQFVVIIATGHASAPAAAMGRELVDYVAKMIADANRN
ncbi:MAG: hypothetical protein IT537_25170 [Hyphomicrobiales bacterium]|nr:hypothetical protein [Hyphomicrobiales bacterium]